MKRLVSSALVLGLAVGVMGSAWPAAPERYELDGAHTNIGFVAKHMLVTNVRGKFNTFSGHITLDPQDVTKSSADVTIQVASIDTDNQRRDDHLRSADFFEAERYPTIRFVSKRVEKKGNDLSLVGDLTIRDVTKEVAIPFELTGPVSNGGRKTIGAEGTLRINRFDYGLKWNRAVETGGLVVGEEIRIELNIQAHTARPAGN